MLPPPTGLRRITRVHSLHSYLLWALYPRAYPGRRTTPVLVERWGVRIVRQHTAVPAGRAKPTATDGACSTAHRLPASWYCARRPVRLPAACTTALRKEGRNHYHIPQVPLPASHYHRRCHTPTCARWRIYTPHFPGAAAGILAWRWLTSPVPMPR